MPWWRVGRNVYKSIDIVNKHRFAPDILKSKNVSNRWNETVDGVSRFVLPVQEKVPDDKRAGKDPARQLALHRGPHNLGSFGTDKVMHDTGTNMAT